MLTLKQIVSLRLQNQLLVNSTITKPEQVVSHLVAMQSQEFSMAKWAIYLRTKSCTEAEIQKAFDEGKILRTHLMRPTWHFASPEDIRWLLNLTAPRVHAISAYMYRQTGLTKQLIKRSNNIIAKNLEGDNQLTRDELKLILEKNKIIADGHRLAYIMMNAELEQIICSGPRKGKQFSYALIDERAAPVKKLTRSEALYTLLYRYFNTRGPATLKDFATWSGLSLTDAKAGAAKLPIEFVREKFEGQEYIYKKELKELPIKAFPTFLMPDYDEYGMSYKDRSVLFNPGIKNTKPKYNHSLVVDGQISANWLRTVKNDKVSVDVHFPMKHTKSQEQKVAKAIKTYCAFSNK